MGVEKQKVSMRWSPETFEQERELRAAFGSLIEDRSHMSRVAYTLAWLRVRTVGIVQALEELTQHVPCRTASDNVAQTEIEFAAVDACPSIAVKKPPVRVAAQSHHGGRRISSVSRRTYVVDRLAYGTSLVFKSTRFMRGAA